MIAQMMRAKLSFKFAASLFSAIVMHTQKTGLDLQLIANHPFFQFKTEFSPASSLDYTRLTVLLSHEVAVSFKTSFKLSIFCFPTVSHHSIAFSSPSWAKGSIL